MAGTNISFDGNNLQTFDGSVGILVQNIAHENMPTKSARAYSLAHTHRRTIPYANYPSRTITISGQIFGSNIADLDNRVDTFKGYFTGLDKNLDVDYAASTRRFTATVDGISIDRPGGLLYCHFSITFDCQPFSSDVATTTLLTASGRTSIQYTDAITVAGNAPVQLPIITITYSAIGSSPVSGTVSIGNANTGQQIYITRTWTTGDVLLIDSTSSTVTVNSLAVNFSGALPAFFTGSGSLAYQDSFASRTFAITANYYKNYI